MTDEKPRLAYIPWSGMGDLIMALPLLASLREHYSVLPLVQQRHRALIELLQSDGILERGLPTVSSLRLRNRSGGTLQALSHLRRIAPEVTLIYGKTVFAAAALAGLFPCGTTLFSTLDRATAYSPGESLNGHGRKIGDLHYLRSTGNQVEDHWRFADHLGHERCSERWRITPVARERLKLAGLSELAGGEYVAVAPWTSDRRRDAQAVFFRCAIEHIIRELGLRVVITGEAGHVAHVPYLKAGLPGNMVVDLVGKTNLDALLGVIAGARFVVANDSGNMHLAALLNTPSVVLFTTTTPGSILSPEWRETVIPVQVPRTLSAYGALTNDTVKSLITDDIAPSVMRAACL